MSVSKTDALTTLATIQKKKLLKEEGFEPSKEYILVDLQSTAFDHSAILSTKAELITAKCNEYFFDI